MDRLLAEGHEVVGIDNLITGRPDNIAHLSRHARFRFVQHDVTNFIYVMGRSTGFCTSPRPPARRLPASSRSRP